tara:strand:+ start:5747 stop:6379 length:633 start_codon:yes stop_codon:yes gene_type:complete
MAGRSSRDKSPGSGYQGAGAKTDYSSNARNSYGTEISRSQKTDYSPNARDSYGKTIDRNMDMNASNTTRVNKSPTNPIGRRYLEPIGPKMPGKTRGIGSIFTAPPAAVTPPAKKPPAVVKPPAKKPPAAAKPVTRGATAPTKKATPRNMPPATRFGTVTGKTTGTTVRGGGGYGGGGTRGGGSLSGGGSGTRSSGTSRTGGTQRNDPVRG